MGQLNTATLEKIADATSRAFTAHLDDCSVCQAAQLRYNFFASLCHRGYVLLQLANDAYRTLDLSRSLAEDLAEAARRAGAP